MDPTIILGLTEVAKLALSAYFQAMALAGKTEEEARQEFLNEQEIFEKNRPELLKDI